MSICTGLVCFLSFVFPSFAGNRVIAWGDNSSGQTNTPAAATNVIAIAAGFSHSLALKADGTVIAWGQAGRTNVPSGLSNVVAIAAGVGQSLALKNDGTIAAWGVPSTTATTNVPPGLSNIVAIACGDDHNLVLKSDGTVFSWGANYSGQTNIPANLSNVVAIIAGNSGNMAIKANGTIWGSGSFTNLLNTYTNVVAGALVANGNFQGAVLLGNSSAQVWGYPSSTTTNIPNITALVGRSGFNQAGATWALQTNGKLFGFGGSYLGQTNVYQNLSNVLAVAIGYSHHLAIVGDGFPSPIASIVSSSFSNNQFRIQQPTTRGRSYRLEYRDALGGGGWQLLPPIPGSGGIETLSDLQAPPTARYYRIRVGQ
jgi:alpha-tubulin suppressor-like RCC1 family protein